MGLKQNDELFGYELFRENILGYENKRLILTNKISRFDILIAGALIAQKRRNTIKYNLVSLITSLYLKSIVQTFRTKFHAIKETFT